MPRKSKKSGSFAASPGMKEARELVRNRLQEAAASLVGEGLPQPVLDGKILRPLTAYLSVPEERRGELDERFWFGALAVEMVHEASLLHDDILDNAPERRGRPSMMAEAGVGPALVLGDHLLTSAYRAAAATRSPEFLDIFIRSVERTVAGEILQEGAQGRVLEEEEYRWIITGKSGELFRSLFALAPALLKIGSPERVGTLGAHLGCLYQMVDDFLDYCPSADRGKVPLQDYRQKKWTWPLGLIEVKDFQAPEEEIVNSLFQPREVGEPSPMERGLVKMDEEIQGVLRELREEGMETGLLHELLVGWSGQMRQAAKHEVELHPAPAILRASLSAAASGLQTPEDWVDYFGFHAKSFRFASRLFPREELTRVAGVYAFCRFTDDLVDEAGEEDLAHLEGKLASWLHLASEAYEGSSTGIPLLDRVVGELGAREVPFHYVEDLVEGIRMDLHPVDYATLEELRIYSYRVASVVGGWLTELFGVREPWVLERAYALGHAMQLTNILRDVGEDLSLGRLYLPRDRMASHGVDRSLLEAMARGGAPIFKGYRDLMEELMERADEDYRGAFEAIPELPGFFQGPVATAARVYQGIHEEIRKNGYDNLTQRASTSLLRKGVLGIGGLLALRRSRSGKGREAADAVGKPETEASEAETKEKAVA